jgi:hypothetical protein
MAIGTTGIVRPADISPEDVEIILTYRTSRTEEVSTTTFLNPQEVLIPKNNPNNTSGFELLGGLYTLKLPTTEFTNKGIYNIYIKPVEIRTRIIDCGILSAAPNIKGLVLNLSEVDSQFLNRFENNGLVGYRIEYLSTDVNPVDKKIKNFFRTITSNNRCEPVNENLTNTNQKSIRYRFNDNSNLTFLTVTPSSPNSVKPNITPFIGSPNQDVIITNTYFNPTVLEIELVEHDFDTLAIGLFGNQSKSVNDGVYTIYNFNDEIYKQYDLYEIQDSIGNPLFEVRAIRSNIDFSKTFTNINNL